MLAQKIKIIPRKKIVDHRGWFVKTITGTEEGLPNFTGEVYMTMATPGQAKGGHYHNVANEWFYLITGSCKVELVDINTHEKMTIDMHENEPVTLFVPAGVAHNFINDSNENFILLAYTDRLFDVADTIAFTFETDAS